MYQFEGKVAIVSGAASGIGRAVAIRLAQEGASVAVFDLPDRTTGEAASGLKETAAEIEKTGAKAYIQLTDVSSAENVEKSFSAVMEHFGRLDIIVNVAGIAEESKAFEDYDAATFDKLHAVNVRGTFNMDKEAVKIFKQQKQGKIINFSSINGITGYAGFYAYNATKFAVTGLTQTLAHELGPYNVNVNCVCPGFVWTPMWAANDRALWDKAHPGEEYVPMTFYQAQCEVTCLKRPTYPEDIAATVAFLASDEARNITGQHINVDCGVEFH